MKTYDERSEDVAKKLNELKRKGKLRRRVIAGSCVMLAVVVLAVTLFIPYDDTPPEVKGYKDSPYYDVICKVNELTYTPPRYEKLFDNLSSNLGGFMNQDRAPEAPAGEMMNGSAAAPEMGSDQYVEVTDNQVQGVTEADIFKRSDKYIYYLSGDRLRIYSIAGQDSAKVGYFEITGFNEQNEKEDQDDYAYLNTAEMYLSSDCRTVTLVMDCYSKTTGSATVILNLDVTDPENVTKIDYVCFPGNIISSRMVDGDLLLTYNFRVNSSDVDFDEPETFIPSYGKPGDMTCIDAEDIICPDTATAARYTVVCKVDGQSLEVEGSTALMSYAQELYVSQNAIYATHSYADKTDKTKDGYTSVTMTKISGIAYDADSLEIIGSIDLEGSVKDQYSMDEYEGILRVVTSTAVTAFQERYDGEFVSASNGGTKRNVNLYCVDLESWKVAACVEAFAPEGERAESVRFDGTKGYVCTAEVITLTDPVYFFDLCDMENITWTDTGTIDGYSTSLIQLGDGFLMGIGVGDARQLKIEVYEELEGKVVSVDAWEDRANFSSVYKAYFIDRENDLIGLAVNSWETGNVDYLLLHFDGYELSEVLRLPLDSVSMDHTRACMIDGEIYILTETGLAVEKVF